MKFVYLIPRFLLIAFIIRKIPEDTFNKYYKANKITRTLLNLVFAFILTVEYLECLVWIDNLSLSVTLLYMFLSQATCVDQVYLIEDVVMLKWKKLRKSLSLEPMVLSSYIYLALNLVTIIFYSIEQIFKGMLLGKNSAYNTHAHVEKIESSEESLPLNLLGYDIKQISFAAHLFVFFIVTCHLVQKSNGEKGILTTLKNLIPNTASNIKREKKN
mmetsp:Transcript_17823/g.17542  ORF Transcript_17823/g.17542 Transcript_17823/m.17542 type:complete len:215 (-) Transcript_17823:44-688(-)